ncbi:MAG: methenyltetrahydromethanopterin cyclohydrolase [Spirochaetota bacterium]
MGMLNERAMRLVRDLLGEPEYFNIKAHRLTNGATVIDMGAEVAGSWAAAEYFTRITLGDLCSFSYGRWQHDAETSFAAVQLAVDRPLIACLASQIAGWQLGSGEFATIGSGPARAVAAVEGDPYMEMTPYRESAEEVVLCVQDSSMPTAEMAASVAEKCRVAPEKVYLLLAPAACLVGSVQVSARILEQVCHKMYENGFDVAKVTNCRGAAPVAPIVKDEVKSMGRINDALLYAGETEFWVDAEDEEIRRVIGRLSSKDSSPQYGVLFEDIFEAAGRDFYYIDHQVHSIGQIRIHSVRSGAAFSAGEYHRELIGRSFLS